MDKISKLIRGLVQLFKKPYLINLILEHEERFKKQVVKKYKLDKGLPVIQLDQLFPEFNETVTPYAFLGGASLVTDLALLKSLARSKNDCIYLEVGSWRGESLANVAPVARECYSINLSDEEMAKMGLGEKYHKQHFFFSKKFQNIKYVRANSLTLDWNSLGTKFDLIFVDGDHHYDAVKSDTENAFKVLKDENSIIVWHDYGKSPEEVRWEVMKAILDGAPEEKGKHIYHVANTLCAIYINKTFETTFIDYPATPAKSFEVKVELANIVV